MLLWQAKDFIMFWPDVLSEEKRPKMRGLWGIRILWKCLTSGIFSVLILNATYAVEIQIYDEAVKLTIFPTCFLNS
jgi:hypothetical protein